MIDQKTLEQLLTSQKNEITEYHIYTRLTSIEKESKNRNILKAIGNDELRHYRQWKTYSKKEVSPKWSKVFFYYWISRILGITFGLKLMERGEKMAQASYARLVKVVPAAKAIMRDEDKHEKALLALLNEERLEYMGSIVLGLNDALVELTGALAGFTLALQHTRLIAVTGLITGLAAALSMSVSEYLSTRTEKGTKHPVKASVYTGIAYMLTVMLLILPYLLLQNAYLCLAWTLGTALLIIAAFNYYVSVAKDENFKSRFLEMGGLSLGVAAISFGIGALLRGALH